MARIKLKRGSREYREGMEHIPSLCKFFGEFTDAVKVREKFQRLERVSSEQEMTRRTKAILDEAPIIVYDKDVN